jgi:hypothetical protein
MENENEFTAEAVIAFAFLEVNGVLAAVAKAALALHQANPKPENVFTFVADEMTRARATNNLFPELRRFAAEKNEFLDYVATTKLTEALLMAFDVLMEHAPTPDDPVAFVAERLRNQDPDQLMQLED